MKHVNLLYAAIGNVTRHRLRGVVVILCLVAILFPFISAVAILEGVKAQASLSAGEGADIYVTMDMYGRNGVIPASMSEEIRKIEGVTRSVPRVISRIYIGGKLAVLFGLPVEEIKQMSFLEGSLPEEGEIVIGKGMADALNLGIGKSLEIGARIFSIVNRIPLVLKKEYHVSGIIRHESGIWASDLVLMNLTDANSVFEMEGFATDIAVYVKPGYEAAVSEGLQRISKFFRIQTKGLVKSYIESGFSMKGGVFVALYTIAFAVAIPALLVTSGFGLSERRKEIGILKATGWQTTEVLEMVFFEGIILALTGACLSFMISYLWIKLFNGFFIAQLFIAGIGNMPPFTVPAMFMPLPLILSVLLSLVLTMAGSIYSSWRAAVVPPAEALR